MTAGVYVIQFPDHVKIGQSADLDARLRGHEKAGAERVRVLDAEPPAHLLIEEAALRAATSAGQRRGAREEFDGLTFEDAVQIVESAAAQHYEQSASEAPLSIQRAITIANLQQTDVARAVGLSYPAWQRRMRGAVPWRASEVVDIARVLGVPLGRLELP